MANEYHKFVGKVGEKTFDEIESTFINETAIKLKNRLLFTDIKFKFSNGVELNCHKWILAQDSQYFLDLFTDNPEIKEIDLSDNKFKFICKYETMVLYLAMLYLNVEIYASKVYNLWYNIFDLLEYINSKNIKNFIAIHITNIKCNYMTNALMNYETMPGKFYYEKIVLFNEFCKKFFITNFDHLSKNAIWMILHISLNINKEGLNNVEKYIEKSDNSLINSILFFIASKFGHKSTNTIYNTKLKDVDIRKLCSECQYILFDAHLHNFIKEVELAKKK